MRRVLPLLLLLFLVRPAVADQNRYFVTSDNVRLHYTVSGPAGAPTLVFVPGWTMPGWIFGPQVAAFSGRYRVVTFDPRGQGDSEIAPSGYNQDRRGQDIAELLARLGPHQVVLVGWSLGVLDTLAYIHAHGDARVAGLVLIDNSVGENPPPAPERPAPHHGRPVSHEVYMRAFVAGMFHTKQSQAYLNRLTAAALRTPAADAALLLAYPVPRSYWKVAIFSTDKPVLYVVRPHLAGQANNLLADRPNTDIEIYPNAGHALFVDEAPQFNALMARFLASSVWPP